MAVCKTFCVAHIVDRLKTADMSCLDIFVIKEVKKESHIEFFNDRKTLFAFQLIIDIILISYSPDLSKDLVEL